MENRMKGKPLFDEKKKYQKKCLLGKGFSDIFTENDGG
jgi:hypothetical protein